MGSTSTTSQSPSNIYTYYENWHNQLQIFFEKLNSISSNGDDDEEESSNALVKEVLDHYQDYYKEKFKSTNSDVFVLAFPPWYTSLERSFLWAAGFKPSMLFPTVNCAVGSELTTEQVEKVNRLKAETKREEKSIEKAMAKVQESVAAPPIFELMKRGGLLVDGELTELENDVDVLKAAMMTVIHSAEHLRGMTVRKLLDILTPKQSVKLMAAVARFYLQARKLGLQMDSRNRK